MLELAIITLLRTLVPGLEEVELEEVEGKDELVERYTLTYQLDGLHYEASIRMDWHDREPLVQVAIGEVRHHPRTGEADWWGPREVSWFRSKEW